LINRLTTLYKLQFIDDQLDELEELRGDLPLAVNELTTKMTAIQNEIDSKEERAKLYIETFSNKSEKKLLAILLPGMCALFIEDAKLYNNVISLIDSHRNSDNFSDCLYAYLHLLYCNAPTEIYEMDKEVKEKLWFSSMRKKLTPYVKSSTGFIEQLFHNQGGRWVLNVEKLVL